MILSNPLRSHLLAEVEDVEAGMMAERDWRGRTALWRASQNDCRLAVAELLQRGAAVDAADREGTTPLMAACIRGNIACAELLLKAGAALEATTVDGKTPLHNAALRGQSSTLQLLVEHGAMVDTRDDGGSTPLLLAARSGYAQCCLQLIAAGADVKASVRGVTPLHEAARRGMLLVVQELLRRQANPDAMSDARETPIAYCRRCWAWFPLMFLRVTHTQKQAVIRQLRAAHLSRRVPHEQEMAPAWGQGSSSGSSSRRRDGAGTSRGSLPWELSADSAVTAGIVATSSAFGELIAWLVMRPIHEASALFSFLHYFRVVRK